MLTARRWTRYGHDRVYVSLDDERIAVLYNGQEVSREVKPGRHRLRVHNTLFWKTIDFEAAPGETIHFNTVNRTGKGFLHLVLILGVAPMFLEVERMKA